MNAMHHPILLGLLSAVFVTSSPTQDPEGPPPPLPTEAAESAEARQGRQEMIELFHLVEGRLKEIDALLFDASAGESLGDEVEESGIHELLRQSTAKAEEVVTGIERILEIASEQGSGSCSSAMKSDAPSPLDQQPQGEQGRKEQTPQKPGEEHEQKAPPQPGGEPHSPEASDEPPENRKTDQQPPEDETAGGIDAVDSPERWGDLPIHVRDLFRTEGGGDMPPRYRDWIDAYYRRLNQAP